MNCANVCPKGLNPAKAIAETKKLIAERSRVSDVPDTAGELADDRPASRPAPARSRACGLVQLGRFPARQLRRGDRAAAVQARRAGPRASCRMFPTESHMNMGGSIHGGAVMSFIDMSMFAGGLCAGMDRGHYVTLDRTTHFIARGQPGVPLDAHVELVKQTRGHAFLQGSCGRTASPATASAAR